MYLKEIAIGALLNFLPGLAQLGNENVYFLRDMARVNRFDRSVQSGLRLSEISNIVRLQRSEYEQIVDSLYIVAQNKREP